MYTHYYGNFLLNNQYITPEQLMEALSEQNEKQLKMGLLAIHAGFMTAAQVEQVHITQTHENKRFGEIAIEKGFLTPEEVEDILNAQKPDFLLFTQVLLDKGYMTNEQLEKSLKDYQETYRLGPEDMYQEEQEKVMNFIREFYTFEGKADSDLFSSYVSLLFNNIVRFVGKDFTMHNPEKIIALPEGHSAYQKVIGSEEFSICYIADEAITLAFASRYAGEDLTGEPEYIDASIEDFLNLHNGLFVTTLSNEYSLELMLEPPYTNEEFVLDPEESYYLIPITFSFGTVSFVVAKEK